METISILAVFLCVFTVLVSTWYRREDRLLSQEIGNEIRVRNLADAATRQELNAFFEKQQVIGDADIRQGIAFAPVPPERLEPLAVLLSRAASSMQQLANPSAGVLYFRDKAGAMTPLDLDIDHLVDAARVMQRVAEDRRKSRSLYRGLTDDEMRAMVRAGLSQWLKDDGSFSESNEVMQGLWDERPEFLMAMNVLDLLFKVKGASNG